MRKINQSIGRKFMLTFAVITILSSILFSASFYFIAMGIIKENVLPQFDEVLHTSSKDIYKGLDNSQALQLIKGNENSRFAVESYLTKKVDEFHLHTAYILDIKEDKAIVIGINKDSIMKVGDELSIQDGMKVQDPGKLSISDLYSDQYGVHKTAYIHLSGSTAVLAVGMDANFVKQKEDQILWTGTGLAAVVIVLALIAAYLNSRRIVKPIKRLAVVTKQMAQGDLSQQITITGHDEIAELSASFQTMITELKEMITKVQNSSHGVIQGSDQIYQSVSTFQQLIEHSGNSMQEVEKGSTVIAGAAEENARAMEEISQGVQHIASSSAEVTERISQASEEADNGNELAKSATEQMRQVEQAAAASLTHISTLNERAASIIQVVDLITNITKQVHILALNAAIEAARAGEHGKGFSVVADEIRLLAEQTKDATTKISEYLLSIQEETVNSMQTMQRAAHEISSGTEQVSQAEIAFSHLTELISEINSSVQSVSAATQQISASTEEVTASVEESATITGKSLRRIEEISNNSKQQVDEMKNHVQVIEQLHQHALSLRESVDKFKV
ncbi:HAMP domain-containing methyl-accepting chemotaxis protein [Paenibacillus sp. D2_2]|uniref:methyl-accepting chemotaxis protein n=1 Tax=Paenibacillus sp. D2_2 TaxID=3073092 RepID=UPI0028165E29|nr:HAMP domain-containing methyl-accepting chemotaxis protein [Paenibacillus sp. D2_2]WMT39876.1 HAMP domain-containing methyl-accepting chemotaxis protein [Paenibacillus sp. D2_2]